MMSSESSEVATEGGGPRIAVVGMACWFPGAENVVQLWENVVAGRQQFRQMPNERMPLAHYHSPDPKTPDMTYGRKAAVIDGFVFDWRGAKIPRPTFETTDVSHWLALEVAGRALRSAGYPSQPSSKDRFGVIVGNTLTGEQSRANAMRLRWPYVRSAFLAALGEEELASSEMLSRFERQYKASLPPVSEDSLAGALSNTIAGRICGRHDLGGGGYTVDAACASSLLAVTTAAERLVAGDLDVALAGGVDVSLDPFELVGFSKAGALAREAMRVYDQRAAGFIPGEGCGFVVLKRLRDAVAAGDRVFAVMRGWGVSSDGSHPIMAPRLDGQIRALRRAYDKAELDPGVIDFVEGHGTGTVVGDRTEITALGAVIGRRAQNSVGLTSLKAVVGHCKAAAGIGAFIKAVVGVNRRCVPPIPGCERPSEVFEQASGRLFPVRSGVMMADAHKPRAGVSAMGFGGINVHAIVEAAGPPASELAPALPERQLLASRQDSELLVVDASSEEEMRQRVDELRKLARGMSVGEMPDLAAACAKREGGRGIRAAIVTGNDESLLEQRLDELHRLASDGIGREPGRRPGIWLGSTDPGCSPRVGMLFPGQGSQLVGAARFLVDRFEWAEAMTSLASTVAAEFRTSDLRDVLYPSEVEGMDEARLAATHRAQPGICLVSLLWLRFLRELGIVPAAATGHSLGELGALHACGFISEHQLLRVASLRGAVVAEHAEPGAMVALASSPEQAKALLAEFPSFASIANVNGARRVTIAVRPDGVQPLLDLAKERRIGALPVSASHGFHSELVAPSATALRERLDDISVEPRAGTCFISGLDDVDGQLPIASLGEHLARHLRQPVDFPTQLRAIAANCDVLIELGPGTSLTRLARADGVSASSILAVEPRPGEFTALHSALAELYVRGASIRWERLYEHRLIRPFTPAAQRAFISNPCSTVHGSEAPSYEQHDVPPPEHDPPSDPGEGGFSLETVRRLIAERTGFELESITDASRLLDDLNLDSIKSAELIVATAASAGVAEFIEPAKLTNVSVHDLYEDLERTRQRHSATAGHESLQLGSWVRSFFIDTRRREPPEPVQRDTPRTLAICRVGRRGPWGEDLSRRWTRRLNTSIELASRAPTGTVVAMVELPAQGGWEQAQGLVDHLRGLARVATTAERLVVVEAHDAHQSPNSHLVGFLRSVALENPQCRVRLVSATRDVGTDMLSDAFARLWAGEPSFMHFGLDGDGRWWQPHAMVLPIPAPQRSWPKDVVVLVTGGGRGITFECARALAQATGCRLALIGRSALGSSEELKRNLNRLDDDGITYHYARADVGDAHALTSGFAELESVLGPISVVIHGAGSNTPRRAHTPSSQEVIAQLTPKAGGLANVLALVRERPLRALVGMGSVIATTGMHGNAWYALSNDLLTAELMAYRRAHPQCHVISVDFGAWAGVGMAARLGTSERLRDRGLSPIEPEQGTRRFVSLVLGKDLPTRVVVTGPVDPSTWPTASEQTPSEQPPSNSPSASSSSIHFPGIERRIRLELDPRREPRLLDHRYQGTLLFPAVLGLEAMAQVASHALGKQGKIKAITNVELEHPIVVPDGKKVCIEVRAHVGEFTHDRPIAIAASIRSESTRYAKDHFRATFHVELSPSPPAVTGPERLDLATDRDLDYQGSRDIYGPLLFQGPYFQWIGRVEQIEPAALVFELEPPATDEMVAHRLGHPGRRDALLQGGQVLVPDADALPVRIERIEFFGDPSPTFRGHCRVRLLESDPEGFVTDAVSTDCTGMIRERMTGMRFRRLRTRRDRPSFEQLCGPGAEGAAALQRRMSEAGYEARVRLVFRPGLGDAPRATRRSVLGPVLEELVADAGGNPTAVAWTDQGPVLEDGTIHMSVSHDRLFGVAAAGRDGIGIDIEPIVSRPPQTWQHMLPRDAVVMDKIRSWTQGDDEAWTRIWSAREALYKLTKQHGYSIEVHRAEGTRIDLRANIDDRQVGISTWRLPLGRGPARIVAVATFDATSTPQHCSPSPPGLETRPGRQGRTTVIHRVVSSFADCITERGTVPLSRLATWMGHARELALLPLRDRLLPLLTSGRWGAVTNRAYVELLEPLEAMSQIEVSIEATHIDDTSASMELAFSRLGASEPVLVGRAGQRFTWVEIKPDGPRPTTMPAALRKYLLDFGAQVLADHETTTIIARPDEAAQTSFQLLASQEDSNLVGNIYFARYFEWIERALAAHSPRHSLTRCTIDYLREAWPGDSVELVLRQAEPGAATQSFVEIARRGLASASARLAAARVDHAPDAACGPTSDS